MLQCRFRYLEELLTWEIKLELRNDERLESTRLVVQYWRQISLFDATSNVICSNCVRESTFCSILTQDKYRGFSTRLGPTGLIV
jgi:hypothetical protein